MRWGPDLSLSQLYRVYFIWDQSTKVDGVAKVGTVAVKWRCVPLANYCGRWTLVRLYIRRLMSCLTFRVVVSVLVYFAHRAGTPVQEFLH